MGGVPGKQFPAPGALGQTQGSNTLSMAQPPTMTPMQPIKPIPPIPPIQPLQPNITPPGALAPGQASIPTGQTPLNPWGVGSGGPGRVGMRPSLYNRY
jgi:hypothetical protein